MQTYYPYGPPVWVRKGASKAYLRENFLPFLIAELTIGIGGFIIMRRLNDGNIPSGKFFWIPMVASILLPYLAFLLLSTLKKVKHSTHYQKIFLQNFLTSSEGRKKIFEIRLKFETSKKERNELKALKYRVEKDIERAEVCLRNIIKAS